MEISYSDLKKYCPVAMTPDTNVYDALVPTFEILLKGVKNLLGIELFDRVSNIDHIPMNSPEYEELSHLEIAIRRFVCSRALYIMVPQIDLVLTPTGFGVVSNQNVAPASAERVAKLIDSLRVYSDLSFDDILDFCRLFIEWDNREPDKMKYFGLLFWRTEHLRPLIKETPHREDFSTLAPEIAKANNAIKAKLSDELYQVLVDNIAAKAVTPHQQHIITMWRNAAVAFIKLDGGWNHWVAAMLHYVEGALDQFPEYAGSRAYQANHFQFYSNSSDDSCYFF